MAETNSLLNCRRGNLSASSNLALSASKKTTHQVSSFFVRRTPLNACGQKVDGEQKSGITQQGLFACKDARGSGEIFNLALSAEVRKAIKISNL